MNRLFYVRQVVTLTRPVSGALVFSCFRVLFYIALQKGRVGNIHSTRVVYTVLALGVTDRH